MLVGVDVDSFVDQQNGNPVVDSVGLTQTLVVQEPIIDEQERSAVNRTYQDVQQFLVDHGRYGKSGGGAS